MMSIRLHGLILSLLLSVLLFAPPVHADNKLATLKPEHPRVLATQADFDRIKQLVRTDPVAQRWYARLKRVGEAKLAEPTSQYELRDGRRLLYVSREVKGRVVLLAMLCRLESDEQVAARYAERVWAELDSAAGFEDWNPDHFLDVAEMGFAFAIGYDWLHDRWTPAQRQRLRDAMVKHAIEPGLEAYRRGTWWTKTKINWNQVCNGGLIATALAVADHEPELAEQMLDRAVASLPIAMSVYAPDGGYEEGPGYWAYGTIYNVFAIAALQSALGTDFGLSDAPGFDRTAAFPIDMTGPTGSQFNFGDNKQKPVVSPAMFYFAKRNDQPAHARFAVERTNGGTFDLLWYDPDLLIADQNDAANPVATRSLYAATGVAALRSDAVAPDAVFVGVKGGAIGFGHSQMDLGSFILESQGQRFITDLGSDDYNLPGYFAAGQGGQRWAYYRNRAEGHNTLVINPDRTGGQRYGSFAPVTLDERLGLAAIVDLAPAYGQSVTRRINLTKQGRVVIFDKLALDQPAEVWWFAHTMADVVLAHDGRSATLTLGGKQMVARLLQPADARFQVMAASPLPTSPDPQGQNPNNGASVVNKAPGTGFVKRGQQRRFGQPDPTKAVRKLAIQLIDATQTTIVVSFEPTE